MAIHDSDDFSWERIRTAGIEFAAFSEGRRRLAAGDFAALLDIPVENLGARALQLIASSDFSYRPLSFEEREALLVDILETIHSGKLTSSGPEKRGVRERGWRENLLDFSASLDPATLTPKFVRKGVPKRLNGEFIMPACDNFEINFFGVMREVLFPRYFADVDKLFEFGCGTGSNLLSAAKILPGVELHALDWSNASIEIIEMVASNLDLDLRAHLFDMFAPDSRLALGMGDAVLTVGALEQLGTGFENFLSFLLQKGPRICLHFETMNEIYDRRTVADYAAITYSRARNYLWGFLGRLRQLEVQGKLRIHQTQRVFGSQFHEGYSFVAWSPILK